jgi:hypothetical protein
MGRLGAAAMTVIVGPPPRLPVWVTLTADHQALLPSPMGTQILRMRIEIKRTTAELQHPSRSPPLATCDTFGLEVGRISL